MNYLDMEEDYVKKQHVPTFFWRAGLIRRTFFERPGLLRQTFFEGGLIQRDRLARCFG